MKSTTAPDVQKIIEESEKALKDFLMLKGRPYPTDEWITVKEYCKRYDTQTVSNWIKRGVIPEENVVTVEEYNNIRLIKAIPYHEGNARWHDKMSVQASKMFISFLLWDKLEKTRRRLTA